MAAVALAPNPNIGLPSTTSTASSKRPSPVMTEPNSGEKPESTDVKKSSPQQSKSSITEPPATTQAEDTKLAAQTTEPLAPPPKPAPSTTAQTPDYFSSVHGGNNNSEFNPFEQSFGDPSTETPGKALALPPVSTLESPQVPGASGTAGYHWNQGLRAGPLSPAMLEGPAGGGDYFGNISRGFPTPNESGLRTGLTPGGGGSMFPAPSPNSQALFNSLQSGGATPGTLDFHRTAMNAAARNKSNYPSTSNPGEQSGTNGNMDVQHDATDAANGLYMLAKGGQANQFAAQNNSQIQTRSSGQQQASSTTGDGDSPDNEDVKPARGKKGAAAKPAANGRRKSEATPKGSNKRQKSNAGSTIDPSLDPDGDMMDDDDMMDDMDDMDDDEIKTPGGKGRKMTDEEKRRNFLERNRIAALKCRQRKKQWLANLQAKVEMYSAENDSLNSQVAGLHDEVRNLRNLLIQHKDCPVGHAQGIGQFLSGMQDPNAAFAHQQMNPYGMAMPNGGMQAGMQRSG